MANKAQWQKRVDVTQYVYICLMSDFDADKIKIDMLNYEFNANQLKLLEYFADNKNEIIGLFSKHLKETWTWDRIAPLTQAIMIVAYCEVKSLNRQVPIAIDQALITADKYGQLDNKKFINAVLDKILKPAN